MAAIVLTYHSHHVVGPGYGLNDHVALPIDLELLSREGVRIVPLNELVALVTRGRPIREPVAAITFDDGPIYDYCDFVHPNYGRQFSFRSVLQSFRRTALGAWQSSLSATSFVIASPGARLVMEENADPQYTWLATGSMTDEWWNDALDEGLIGIANHSWDHLHPALVEVAHSRKVRADFTAVDNRQDADSQIASATRYIQARTSNRMAPYFAYPFGHHNAFLTDEYLPNQSLDHNVCAAFSAEPALIFGGESRWCLPRFICGHHWKAPDELRALLQGGVIG